MIDRKMMRICHFSKSVYCTKWNRSYPLQTRELSQIKMVKTLKKMLERGPKKKWHKNPTVHVSPGLSTKKGVSDGQRRRSEQVSKVLYRYITSIVNSGELSPKIAAMAIDIAKVKVLPDFSGVNIYWLSSGSDSDEELETLLKQHEAKLRQILMSYHILGNIPYISFVRDDSPARYMDIEKILKTVDFGPDFEPTHEDTSIRPGLQQISHQSQNADVTKQFQKMSLQFVDSSQFKHVSVMDEQTGSIISASEPSTTETSDISDNNNVELPDSNLNYRSDVYGLHHNEIMQRLMLKKYKTKYRTMATESDTDCTTESQNRTAVSSDYDKYVRKLTTNKKGSGKYRQYTLVDQMKEEGDSWKTYQDEKGGPYTEEDSDDEDYRDR